MDPREADGQKHDMFISLTGALYVTMNSQKTKGKALEEHMLKDLIPHMRFDSRIKEIQKEHQKAIQTRDNRIQTIQYKNVGLQGKT